MLPPALRSPTININTDTDRKLRFSIHDSGSTTNFAAPRLPSGSVGILPSFSALECASGQLGRELPARPHTSSFGPVWIPFRHSVCFPLGFRGCVGRPSIGLPPQYTITSSTSACLGLERLRTGKLQRSTGVFSYFFFKNSQSVVRIWPCSARMPRGRGEPAWSSLPDANPKKAT